ATNTTFTVLNFGLQFSWFANTTVPWLSISSYNSSLSAGAITPVTISLVPGAVNSLVPGTHYGAVTFSNSFGETQTRIFVLTVCAGAQPLAISGFNAGTIVPTNGTSANPQAIGFGAGSAAFYQAGLPGSTRGVPFDRRFVSGWDGQT